VFYYNVGLDYVVNDALNIGAIAQADLSNKDYNLTTVGVKFQVTF